MQHCRGPTRRPDTARALASCVRSTVRARRPRQDRPGSADRGSVLARTPSQRGLLELRLSGFSELQRIVAELVLVHPRDPALTQQVPLHGDDDIDPDIHLVGHVEESRGLARRRLQELEKGTRVEHDRFLERLGRGAARGRGRIALPSPFGFARSGIRSPGLLLPGQTEPVTKVFHAASPPLPNPRPRRLVTSIDLGSSHGTRARGTRQGTVASPGATAWRRQARVSELPGLTTMRGVAGSSQRSPGGSTMEADRTRNERGLLPGAGTPCSARARAALIRRQRTWMMAVSLVPSRSRVRSTMGPWLSWMAWSWTPKPGMPQNIRVRWTSQSIM